MILEIIVRPGSKEQKIEKISDNKYKFHLKEKAENGRANLKLLKLLTKEFKKPARIIRGVRSRNKIVEIK